MTRLGRANRNCKGDEMSRIEIDIRDQEVSLKVDGIPILDIDQVSDENTINLFLIPCGSTSIVKTDQEEGVEKEWTHEVLRERR